MARKKDVLDNQKAKEVINHLIKTTRVIMVKKSKDFFVNLHQVAKELGYIKDFDFNYPDVLTDNDILRCVEHIWNNVLSGILAPGWGPSSGSDIFFPNLHITEYGRKVMSGVVNPYLADDYTNDIKTIAPNLIDSIAEMYISEALKSFKFNCFLGAMVLLGGFSERIFIKFLDQFLQCIQDPAKQSRINNQIFIAGKFNEFLKVISPLRSNLPQNIKHQLELWLKSFFNYVRQTRNTVGHPTGKQITRAEIHGMLIIFPTYLQKLVDLLNYFISNPIP